MEESHRRFSFFKIRLFVPALAPAQPSVQREPRAGAWRWPLTSN